MTTTFTGESAVRRSASVEGQSSNLSASYRLHVVNSYEQVKCDNYQEEMMLKISTRILLTFKLTAL